MVGLLVYKILFVSMPLSYPIPICMDDHCTVCKQSLFVPISNPICLAYELEGAGGAIYHAIAKHDTARIPGKARDGKCWFPYDKKELHTDDFELVHTKSKAHLILNDGSGPPRAAIKYDNCGLGYALVAITQYGTIPGVFKEKEKKCVYTFKGEYHMTETFYWVTVDEPTTSPFTFK